MSAQSSILSGLALVRQFAVDMFDTTRQVFLSENNRYWLYGLAAVVTLVLWLTGFSLPAILLAIAVCLVVPPLLVAFVGFLVVWVIFGYPSDRS